MFFLWETHSQIQADTRMSFSIAGDCQVPTSPKAGYHKKKKIGHSPPPTTASHPGSH